MRMIMDEGRNGFLVPPGDVQALREAIASLVASPELRFRFGRRSRELFEEQFSAARMVRETNCFYDKLLGRVTATAPGSERQPVGSRTASP
jgi:glycosyltransferase involved in cell wall biosynthesis